MSTNKAQQPLNMVFSLRLRQRMAEMGINGPYALARRLQAEGFKISGQGVQHYIDGKFVPKGETLYAIAKCLKKSMDWFFDYDPGTMDETHAFIPLYAVEAAAGLEGISNGDFPEVIDRFPFKRAWLQSKGCGSEGRLARLALIKVRGDSMEPTISDGELILVDTDESVRMPESIRNGGVYVLRWGITGEGISVKRVHLDWQDGLIIARSDNELYRPKEIRVGDKPLSWYVLGRVIWVGKENI